MARNSGAKVMEARRKITSYSSKSLATGYKKSALQWGVEEGCQDCEGVLPSLPATVRCRPPACPSRALLQRDPMGSNGFSWPGLPFPHL